MSESFSYFLNVFGSGFAGSIFMVERKALKLLYLIWIASKWLVRHLKVNQSVLLTCL